MDLLKEISVSLQLGDIEKVTLFTGKALESKMPPKDILYNGLINGMNIVGNKYKLHEIFLPDVLLAAKAMYAGLDILNPMFIKEGIPTIGKIVIGMVQGDLHDIGKNLEPQLQKNLQIILGQMLTDMIALMQLKI